MTRNGFHHPHRPRIEVKQTAASPSEAAAIAAAIEQFLRDTAPPPTSGMSQVNPWERAALFEGAGLRADAPSPFGEPWGDPDPWGA